MASSRQWNLCLFLFYLHLIYDGVGCMRRSLSAIEEAELENELKRINKPAVKTIKTEYGDIYDCVDFYNQPGFDHPLLKDHDIKLEAKPTLHVPIMRKSLSQTRRSTNLGFKEGGCPYGTVPIKRITKEDLIREREFAKWASSEAQNPNALTAQVHTKPDPNAQFNGAGCYISIWNPTVEGQQYSASRVKVQKGHEMVVAGWRIDPTLNGDNQTRRFIFYTNGRTQCYNTRCPGFIIVNFETPVDYVFPRISKIGGPIWEHKFFLNRDVANGNWWLQHGENLTEIGFWPGRIFNELSSSASSAEWGGIAFSPPGVPKPPMGSGAYPSPEPFHTALFDNVVVLTNTGATVDAGPTETHEDYPYEVQDFPHVKNPQLRHLVLYGGPGT